MAEFTTDKFIVPDGAVVGVTQKMKSSDVGESSFADSVVIVKQASDLSGTLLSTKAYVIDGIIDMGAQTITVPSGGLSMRGAGSISDALTSSENAYTMFVDAASDAGTLVISGISFMVSGTSSKVFDLDTASPTAIFSLDRSAFIGCTEIGTVKDYPVITISTCQYITCGNGFTFDGSSVLLSLVSGASSGMLTGGTLYAAGGSMSITGNCLIEKETHIIGTGATLCNFADANFVNDAGFEVLINNISGAGSFFSAMNGDSVKARWRDNNFDPASAESNTYVGAIWEVTTEAQTVVSVAATDYKVAGTTTYAEEYWFSNTTDNAFVYDSSRSIKVEINGAVSITGTNGHEIQLKIRKWDDSASGYVDIQTVPAREMSSTGAAASVAILAYTTLDSPSDRIELWGQNIASTGNFIVKDYSVFSITERAN
jgi:hypothetical protein